MSDMQVSGELPPRPTLLLLAICVEGTLLGVASGWAYLAGIPLWSAMRLDGRSLLLIAAGTAALGLINIGGFALLRRRVAALQRFDRLLRAIFAPTGLPDLVLISALAGLGEEAL